MLAKLAVFLFHYGEGEDILVHVVSREYAQRLLTEGKYSMLLP